MSGSEASLAECIANGSVPKPALVDWQDWQRWRKGAGKRPTVGQGDSASTTSRQESELWRATLQRLYGANWRALLEEQQAAETATEEEADAASAVGGGTASAAASVAGSAAASGGGPSSSAPGTPQRLRQALLQEYDAAAETGAEYQRRMDLITEQLESLGQPVTAAERL